MKSTAARFARYGVGLLGLVSLGWILAGHAAPPYQHGMPTDWTHRHVIFSQPRSAKQLAQLSRDPRYWQQWMRHNVAPVLGVNSGESALAVFIGARKKVKPKIKRDWSEDMGSGASMGAGQFAAKYSFSLTTATCSNVANPDYTVFSTGLQSAGSTASIVAFDNLYSGCGSFGSVPTTYWAYNTTAATVPGTIRTSPVISLDGSQISFVQTDGLGHGTVVLLKWKANDGTLASPSAPALKSPANYVGCTAPCMTTFDLRIGLVQTDDVTSSVYYDYGGDVAWVGDSLGLLHKFHPFFLGTPAEVTAGPWPVQANVSNHAPLSSPVYDQFSNSVFMGDGGGFVERVDATTGAATVSGQVDFGTGLFSGPILDQTSGRVYVFSSNDNSTNCVGNPCSAVFQFTTAFGAGSSGSEAQVGASSGTPNPLYEGGFDSAYWSSSDATGSLYVCGNTGLNPILFRVPITAGTMAVSGTAILLTSSSTAACSPVTDVPNPNAIGGSEERLFVSPQDNGEPTACANSGCLISIVDSPWKASTAYVVGQEILVRHVPTGTLHTEVAITAGTSSTSPPATWTNSAGATVTDGGVTWLDQGALTTVPLGNWTALHGYAPPAHIVDSNGSVEVVRSAGLSGGTVPTWATTVGGTTTDGAVTWVNAGALPVAALPANGGTSGVISDNIVGAGTLAGTSQVYFSTLADQPCPTSGGTGGCAVQASQSALQ